MAWIQNVNFNKWWLKKEVQKRIDYRAAEGHFWTTNNKDLRKIPFFVHLKRFETQQSNQLQFPVEMHDMQLFSMQTTNSEHIGQYKDCKVRFKNNAE